MEWIQVIYPDFSLKLWVTEELEDAIKTKEKYNQQQYGQFEEWWKVNKNTDTIKAILANKNNSYHD